MNAIKFLGTAGARFVVMQQLRASGGLWLTLDDTTLLIDPGPGSLVRCLSSRPKLNPRDLDGIILTHRHLDHANDINIMIEAMTNGGFKKKGVVFAPADALEKDAVILRYIRPQVDRIEILMEKGKYKLGNISFSTPIRMKHGVEAYGLNLKGKSHTISLITDTDFFDGLASHFKGDILIINVVLLEEKSNIDHLCLKEAEQIIADNAPKLAILTHFGMGIIKAKPWELAEKLSKKLKVPVLAARDGMELNLDAYQKR
ncbi:MAG TPA: MBL fold metallo-hydrolase [Candidatus Thermoplasmatota archaeon]|nr:MBL fold metallo-hydrolase [Candidatus Thermoplasmatota archaeon]